MKDQATKSFISDFDVTRMSRSQSNILAGTLRRARFVSLASFSALVLSSTIAFADELEGVCDEVIDATPGLHGLCVSYCEAFDDVPYYIDDRDDAPIAQIAPPARSILKVYDKLREDGDPTMPCVFYESACPAWTAVELALVGGEYTLSAEPTLIRDNMVTVNSYSGRVYTVDEQWYRYDETDPNAYYEYAIAQVQFKPGKYGRPDEYSGVISFKNIEGLPLYKVTTNDLTPAQYSACLTELEDNVMPVVDP